MLFSAAVLSVLAGHVVMASPILKARDELPCTADGSSCKYSGCWTETDGAQWCSDEGGEAFNPHDLLFDTEIDLFKRREWVKSIPDDVIIRIIGEPQIIGDSPHISELKPKIILMAKSSAPAALEVADNIAWGVQFTVADNDTASWYMAGAGAGQGLISFQKEMIIGDTLDFGLGVLAHEMGHAIFDHRGYEDALNVALKKAGLDDRDKYGDLNGILNEPTAGILAHRGTLYDNYNNPDKTSEWWLRLSWARDVKSLFEVDGGYWKIYNLKPAAMDVMEQLIQVGTDAFLNSFKAQYGLQNDPYLLLPASAPL